MICNNPNCQTEITSRATSGLCKTHSHAQSVAKYTAKHPKMIEAKAAQVRRHEQERLLKGEILPPETPSFYENYKEPLKKVENGFGYMGTLATNEAKTHVQCHVCGLFFKSLSQHISKRHNLPAKEYKEKFGLMLTNVLIGEATREAHIASGRHRGNTELPVWLHQYNQDVRSGARVHKSKTRMTLEERNKLGVCPDQLLEKITDLAKILGRTPSLDEFTAHYKRRYYMGLMNTFGGWNKAVNAAGMVSVGQQRELTHSPEALIKYLQDFQKLHNRIPVTSDFSRGLLPARYHYHKTFGTLNDARVAAGMNAIVALPRHQWMEITKEEWEDYRARHNLRVGAAIR